MPSLLTTLSLLGALLACCHGATIKCDNANGKCTFSGQAGVDSFECSNSNGDCDCGQAVDCTCSNSNGNCDGRDVTGKLTCDNTNGDCVGGKAKTVKCTNNNGKCTCGAASDSCSCENANGGCDASKATGKVTCDNNNGECTCGKAESCDATSASSTVYCGESKSCSCSGENSNCRCQNAQSCTCSQDCSDCQKACTCCGASKDKVTISSKAKKVDFLNSADSKCKGSTSNACSSSSGSNYVFTCSSGQPFAEQTGCWFSTFLGIVLLLCCVGGIVLCVKCCNKKPPQQYYDPSIQNVQMNNNAVAK